MDKPILPRVLLGLCALQVLLTLLLLGMLWRRDRAMANPVVAGWVNAGAPAEVSFPTGSPE